MGVSMSSSVHFSSKTDNWATPADFYDRLNAVFDFTLDPCASDDNAKCKRYFTERVDGLSQSWDGERVLMNPPYGREIGLWVKKASEAKSLVVCLVPARTDTRWWHDYVVAGGGQVTYLKGRLKFGGVSTPAPFPSALVMYYGHAIK